MHDVSNGTNVFFNSYDRVFRNQEQSRFLRYNRTFSDV